MTFNPGNPIKKRLAVRYFADPADLVAGQLYHLVFRNVDASLELSRCRRTDTSRTAGSNP